MNTDLQYLKEVQVNIAEYNGPCIYTIWTSEDPEKVYIGKTINYKIRSKRHITDLKGQRHGNSYLQRLFNKGYEFNICPLEICDKETLSYREEFWVSFYKTNTLGYNLTKGGESAPEKLITWSEDRKKAWSKYCSDNPIAKGVKRSALWHTKMQDSIQRRKNAGTLMIHLNKECTVLDILTNKLTTYANIKVAAKENNLARSYVYEKLKKGKGAATIKHFIIKVTNEY